MTGTRKYSMEIKFFLSSSHYNSSKLQFILQCVKSQGGSLKLRLLWNPAVGESERAAHPVGSGVHVRVNKSICLCVLRQSLRDMTSVHLASDSADRRRKGRGKKSGVEIRGDVPALHGSVRS